MEDLNLSAAMKFMIEELMDEFKISRTKARTLLANTLYRNIVIAEVKNEAAYILEKED